MHIHVFKNFPNQLQIAGHHDLMYIFPRPASVAHTPTMSGIYMIHDAHLKSLDVVVGFWLNDAECCI